MKSYEWIKKRQTQIALQRKEAYKNGNWGKFYGLALVAEELTEILSDTGDIKKR